jgi:hypothetical protein
MPPTGSRAHAKNEIIQGLRLLLRHRDYSAHLFAQQRMRRTSQLVGFDFSTGRAISPLPVNRKSDKGSIDFHDVSRASTDAQDEPLNAVHLCVFAKLLLPAWEVIRRLKIKPIGVHGVDRGLSNACSFRIFDF